MDANNMRSSNTAEVKGRNTNNQDSRIETQEQHYQEHPTENTKKRSRSEELIVNASNLAERTIIDLTEADNEVIDLTMDDEDENRNDNKENTARNLRPVKVSKKDAHARDNKHKKSRHFHQLVHTPTPKVKHLPPIPEQTRLVVLVDLDQRADFIRELDVPFKKVIVYGFMGAFGSLIRTAHATVIQVQRRLKEAADYELMLYVSGWLARNELAGKTVIVVSADRGVGNVVQILSEWGVKAAIINDKGVLNKLIKEAET